MLAAKQNAAATAMAQTKYAKPVEKKTMKARPHGITATQELHEAATKKGLEAKFKFLEPANFDFKPQMRLWSKEEMRGNYRVQLIVNGFEYFGHADLPQQAKHNAAMQALPMLNRLPDAANASKVSVVIPNAASAANGSASAGGAGGAGPAGDKESVQTKNVIMMLNEIAMSQNQCLDWNMVREDGPPHARKFTWSLKMGEHETMGIGCSKKIAKSLAAQSMFEKIPDDWKKPAMAGSGGAANGKFKKRKQQNRKRKVEIGVGGPSALAQPPQPGIKKAKKEGEVGATPEESKPAYEVIHATNPISALYEYCRKSKLNKKHLYYPACTVMVYRSDDIRMVSFKVQLVPVSAVHVVHPLCWQVVKREWDHTSP